MPPYRWFAGWDPRELRAWNVAHRSGFVQSHGQVDIRRLAMGELVARGLYWRSTHEMPNGGYWDVLSEAPMSTGHAIGRFLVPALCEFQGWALFSDGDVLVRRDLAALFALADPAYAVQVVQHAGYVPADALKMDGQVQTVYPRKNWSSVILFHCGHPANAALTPALVNTVPGRDLHRFCWLDDALIGALPPEWNVLIGEQAHADPAIAHFTRGTPDMAGYEQQPFADEWYAVARAAGYRLTQPAP